MEDVEEEKRVAEIESDEEVFEINDFTNATPWERYRQLRPIDSVQLSIFILYIISQLHSRH